MIIFVNYSRKRDFVVCMWRIAVFVYCRICIRCDLCALRCGYLCVVGNFSQECVVVCGVVHLATVVFEPVADYQVVYFQYEVVSGYLCKYVRGDCDCRGFVFDDGFGGESVVIYDSVASEFYAV